MASVLVIDESDVNRWTLAARLELLGHRVHVASCIQDGLEALQGRSVELVLLDVSLSDDGVCKLLAQRQDDSNLREIPFAVLAGPEDMHLVSRCIELGADDYLSKPFDPILARLRIDRCLALTPAQAHREPAMSSKPGTKAGEREEPGGLAVRLRRFLSPQIADAIAASADDTTLQSHRREITVCFCDLRGFTAFSEAAAPEDVMGVLREYHGAMGEVIFAHDGTLEHFAGDGMMVFFNDPVPLPDPAGQAVRMAIALRERANELGLGWHDRGYDLGMGMGIAMGYATLGQIGFEGRFDYGAIGPVTNLASRLCGEAATGQILVHRRVYSAVRKQVDAEPVGSLELKGFQRPVEAFNIVRLNPGIP